MMTCKTSAITMILAAGFVASTSIAMAGGPPACFADVTGDNRVNYNDLGFVLDEWGVGGDPAADVNQDGVVGPIDYASVLTRFGRIDSCNTIFPNVGKYGITVSSVDNSDVRLGDDTQSPGFDGGTTHFTYEVSVKTTGNSVWLSGSMNLQIEPDAPLEVFQYDGLFSTGDVFYEDSGGFGAFPSMLYDTAVGMPYPDTSGLPFPADYPEIFPADSVVSDSKNFVVPFWRKLIPLEGPTTLKEDTTIARITIAHTGGGLHDPILILPGGNFDQDICLDLETENVLGTFEIETLFVGQADTPGWYPSAQFLIVLNPFIADVNGDLRVDTADLGLIIAEYGTDNPYADVNRDRIVDTADLGLVISEFGLLCFDDNPD